MQINGRSNTIHGIILAAGPGGRQRVLTDHVRNRCPLPKAILPVGTKALIDFSIDALKHLGLQQIHAGVGTHPFSEFIERQISKSDIYKVKISPHSEHTLLDTAGTTTYILEHFLSAKNNDTICVLPCDTPHQIDLDPILKAHHKNHAAVTMAVIPIEWHSGEWSDRSFATVQLEGMPKLADYANHDLFEKALRSFAKEHKGESLKVAKFNEKEERKNCQSNLINIGFYFFNAEFLMRLIPFIRPKGSSPSFSDFGLHIFPFLGGRHEEFSSAVDPEFLKQVKNGDYPFHAYVLSEDVYWRDVWNPLTLLKANMDFLDGRFGTAIDPGDAFWHQKEWGWQGNFGTSIDQNTSLHTPLPGSIGSIIGNHVLISSGAKVERSVIRDHLEIAGSVKNSVCLPNYFSEQRLIGRGVKMLNSIFVGGELHYSKTPRHISDSIVYPDFYGGIAFAPI